MPHGTFASHGVIRNLGYEFFKATHLFAVVIFMIILFWHCDYTLTSWHYFIATAAVYVPCFVFPWLRTGFEYGFGQKAYIHVEENGLIRLTIPSVNMRWKPGQHCFLRFTSLGLQAFTSHPFTICSLPSIRPGEKSELVFYIRHQQGLTKNLYAFGQEHAGTALPVLVDGPYGGTNMQRYNGGQHQLVIAGGSGAGWTLAFIELFQRHHSPDFSQDINQNINQDVKPKDDTAQLGEDHDNHNLSNPYSLRVVLAMRDAGSRIWFLRTVNALLSKYSALHAAAKLDVQVYLTSEAEHNIGFLEKVVEVTAGSASTSSSDDINVDTKEQTASILGKELSGRPDLPRVVQQEAASAMRKGQSLNVFVCGPATMNNDVRNAVANENLKVLNGSRKSGVYLHSEHFAWT